MRLKQSKYLIMQKIQLTTFFLCFFYIAISQEHYTAPKDSLILNTLHQWQDIKFGLMVHWGPYSEWGVTESWTICPEDERGDYIKGPFVMQEHFTYKQNFERFNKNDTAANNRNRISNNYFDYKKKYESLPYYFNPIAFDPKKWAHAAKDAGMRYIVFTTKHHDGFCMFDTKQTNYKITSPIVPYSTQSKANISKEVFDAFRKDGFMIGAYYSKPDWHSPDYWWPYYPPKDRNPNYDVYTHRNRWEAFKRFTYNQLKELTNGDYGKIDLLWLDGGWITFYDTIGINMDTMAVAIRKNQPGILIVDRRTNGGPYENYLTPEQAIPNIYQSYPWESCITMSNNWSYNPHPIYKPTQQLIHILIQVVAFGGNLLLNIGAAPDGTFDSIAYNRLYEIGKWMHINNEAIYYTKPMFPYHTNDFFYTQSKNGKTNYVFYVPSQDTIQLTSDTIQLQQVHILHITSIHLLGYKSPWRAINKQDRLEIIVPKKWKHKILGQHALVWEINQ